MRDRIDIIKYVRDHQPVPKYANERLNVLMREIRELSDRANEINRKMLEARTERAPNFRTLMFEGLTLQQKIHQKLMEVVGIKV